MSVSNDDTGPGSRRGPSLRCSVIWLVLLVPCGCALHTVYRTWQIRQEVARVVDELQIDPYGVAPVVSSLRASVDFRHIYFLRDLASSAENLRHRTGALFILGALDAGRHRDVLLLALNDRDSSVRTEAFIALGKAGDPSLVPKMFGAYRREVLGPSRGTAAWDATLEAVADGRPGEKRGNNWHVFVASQNKWVMYRLLRPPELVEVWEAHLVSKGLLPSTSGR